MTAAFTSAGLAEAFIRPWYNSHNTNGTLSARCRLSVGSGQARLRKDVRGGPNRHAVSTDGEGKLSTRPPPRRAKFDPRWSVVACALFSPHPAVYAACNKPLGKIGAQKDVIEAQPLIAWPTMPHVVPKRVHGIARMQGANCVGPTLIENLLKRRTALRLHESIIVP